MRMRRMMSALVLAFAAGLSAACGTDADDTAKSAAPASGTAAPSAAASGAASGATGGATSAAASSPVGAKADTERICKNVIAAFEAEKMQLLEVLLKMATAEDQATKDKAKADAAALVGRLKTVVDKETATAADPKAKAALQALVATLGKMLTPEGVADPDFEKKLDAATAEASTYCPGLDAA
ncbi:hypothetical protein [Dactylosporangium sp. NPDC005555]|uniref:hypothetical protein n=1 Tax=Dactylosporangium sp. NPDC005555 TaxID=3154889 RepID=UPI0033AA5DA6